MPRVALLLTLPFISFAQSMPADSFLLISLRKDFEKASKFSPEPQLKWVELNTDTASGLLSSLNEAGLATAVRGKRVLLLIHGMRTPFYRAKKYYREAVHWAGETDSPPYDMAIGLLWPGYEPGGSRLQVGIAFLKANPRARKSGKKLAPLLELLAEEAQSLDVMTHSMGSKVALFALKKQDGKVDNLFLMAPSIGAKTLDKNRKYGFAGKSVRERAIVFYSRHDPAFQSIGRKMMGHRGIVSKNPLPEEKYVNVDCSEAIRWHSAYWGSQLVFGILEGYLSGEGMGH